MIHLVLALALLSGGSPLTLAAFEKLHAELVPGSAEKWQQVPWKIDLLEACAAAARAGRPLFLWSMNGHPLGCT